jgi:group II intron reverse transcriptase/maturase
MVLEPIYETDFSDDSFGFRPNRSTHDAIMSLRQHIFPAAGAYKPWVLDLDVKGYFDNVDHQTLEQVIQNRITDQKMRDLIWEFLKAGIMEDGKYRHSMLGTPQGGIVSPLLANVYLNELDQWVNQWTNLTTAEKRKRWNRGKGSWHYVRYADDFLLLTNGTKGRAEKMMERVEDFIDEELNLTLSDEKSELNTQKTALASSDTI